MSRSTHLTPLAIRTIKVRVELVARGISAQRGFPPFRALCTQGMRSRTKRGMKEVRLRLARLSLLVPRTGLSQDLPGAYADCQEAAVTK